MLIDWFTVGAQVLNFVILVWLMKRFLYKPVLDAIAARENRIAEQLADAAATKAEAHRQQDEFLEKNRSFDAQRAELLRKATDEANAEGRRQLDAARTAAESASASRAQALRADARHLNTAIVQHTQREVFAIARKVLADLTASTLEDRAVAVFVERLRALDGPAKDSLGKALKDASEAEPARVRSAFELPAPQRAAIHAALDEIFAAGISLRFETAPELIGGIELVANGQKLAWSISDYLGSVATGVDELLKTQEPATS